MENFEIQLVQNAQNGNHKAFEKLIALHDKRIYQLAFGVVGNIHDAQDIYQETFLNAWSRLQTYAFDGAFGAWLNRIVINLSINKLRQKRRRKWLDFTENKDEFNGWRNRAHTDSSPGPDRLVISEEIGTQVQKALADLPAKQRAIFVMKHFHGMKITEIAGTLECAEGTVKNQLFRATQKLKIHFKRLYNENT
ncbi:MAG: RNA polymerase sigma factor [Deferribacteres bacterium]|nr:RNA polymerase sigma factor [candidate division KSB1 bacterium]MCB9503026.1 RNA polymerase sigma factor [Deferribacteres bacterium]